jgi:hypothetical protein
MPDDNNRNLLFFESESMKGLYEVMASWQNKNGKRLLSTHVQPDGDKFCCIALTNPSEVIIVDGGGGSRAKVENGILRAY